MDVLGSFVKFCIKILFMFRWHHGQYFIQTPGDYTISFDGIRGSGIYSDLALDDITLGVSSDLCFDKDVIKLVKLVVVSLLCQHFLVCSSLSDGFYL